MTTPCNTNNSKCDMRTKITTHRRNLKLVTILHCGWTQFCNSLSRTTMVISTQIRNQTVTRMVKLVNFRASKTVNYCPNTCATTV